VDGLSIVEAAAKPPRNASGRFLTTLVASLGLLPAAISNGIGAQTQKPLAIVVVGGSLMLATITRVLQPPLRVLAPTWLGRRAAANAEPAVDSEFDA
jgi:cobalt-zinc-cadmium resistance protein CzcA